MAAPEDAHPVWQPWYQFYIDLTSNEEAGLSKALDKAQPWLLAGPSRWQPASAASQKLIEQQSISLAAGKLVVDGRLREATNEVARLLNLDAVQAHMLLKRWIKQAEVLADVDKDAKLVLDAERLEQVRQLKQQRRRDSQFKHLYYPCAAELADVN